MNRDMKVMGTVSIGPAHEPTAVRSPALNSTDVVYFERQIGSINSSATDIEATPARMSIIGFADSPGTAVLPMC
jgi:hypothetical protein